MTIAQAFNEITIAQGGTPNGGGTITGAIDALNDTLAGSDQAQGRTIEDAVRLLGQHIGGGSSINVEPLNVTENDTYTAPEGKAYSPVTVDVAGGASFGDPQSYYMLASSQGSTISVGDYFYDTFNGGEMPICEVDSGDDVIISSYTGEYPGDPKGLNYINSVASGLTVKSAIFYSEDFDYDFRMAIVEAEYDEEENFYSITSVVQDLSSSVSQSLYTTHNNYEYAMFTFVVPEVPEGKYLVYSVQYPD